MQEDRFLEVLREHTARYPKMEPQDCGKLIYQSEFGPEHMLGEKKFVLSHIREEFAALPEKSVSEGIEPIGQNVCRFPLSMLTGQGAFELCADLFFRTAEECQGTMEGLLRKISLTEQFWTEELQRRGMKEWLSDWKRQGYLPIHHSRIFHETYQPHYRLLCTEYAVYFSALLEIARLMKEEKPIVIGIDGRCGSGKSHFAAVLEKLFSCNVVHMDDYYLPPEKRSGDWERTVGGNMDFDRFRQEVLLKVWAGEPILYRPYRCSTGLIEKELPLPPRKLTVVEGSYSHHPGLKAEYDVKIFLTCSKQTQFNRLKKREGDYYNVFKQRWIPMEEHYFTECCTAKNSNIIIETDLL